MERDRVVLCLLALRRLHRAVMFLMGLWCLGDAGGLFWERVSLARPIVDGVSRIGMIVSAELSFVPKLRAMDVEHRKRCSYSENSSCIHKRSVSSVGNARVF